MAASEQVEVELKFDVDPGHMAPDLRALPGVVSATEPETFSLDATYFDTENLDLAGNRITMRRRTGGTDQGWHLKRPTDIPGARRELQIGFDEAPADGDVPEALVTPVLALTRCRRLTPVAVISTTRTVTRLLGVDDEPLAELAEDLVTAQSLLPGGHSQQWAEWEFELLSGGTTKLLKAADKVLRAGGARPASSASKLARAIGSTPTVHKPRLSKRPTALELVITDIALHRNSLIAYDPLVREDADDAVHQMRVSCRRLRSVLSGYPTVLDAERTAHVGAELKLLARILGDARDSEVQLELDKSLLRGENASAELLAALAGAETQIHDRAIRAAHAAMSSKRYFALLDSVDALIASPPPGPDAELPATVVVDKAVAKSRKHIRKAQADLADLTEGSAEWQEQLHKIRKRAKRLRYSIDATEPLNKKKYREVGAVAKKIQSALGDFNDIRINRDHLATIVADGKLGAADMFIVGRLDARLEADAYRAVAEYRKAAKDL
ncbi:MULTISPECIES: CYTH and CHAD domain-containing protein [Gordonia]|uniref:Metal-chelation protein CHAD n=1 Tax=Gordonia alkanivorans CGMCC 6845 TaxID=1423140 RepID=W9DA15_9ACTN|nr:MULTISPECIES: CYTH and CHAD domain-containing protein [Gordonia]ETA05207.1 metal-chelation protein CHAD [Gordonia alkanivorans CGMCC 6845]WJG12023.1 CYTH and CHAD domain-containing protein [Gordonia sp. Swx-4]